jgi:hypothetical protein
LSALIDGELDPEERDRVLNHVAGCQGCLREVNAMRALKRRLTSLAETSADTTMTSRLIELASSDHGPASGLVAQPLWASARQRQVKQAWAMAVGSAGTALAVVGFAAFLLGNSASAPAVPKVTPSVDSYLLQHAHDAGEELVGQDSGSAGSADPASFSPAEFDPALSPARPARGQEILSPLVSPPPVTPALASPAASASASPGKHPARHATR